MQCYVILCYVKLCIMWCMYVYVHHTYQYHIESSHQPNPTQLNPGISMGQEFCVFAGAVTWRTANTTRSSSDMLWHRPFRLMRKRFRILWKPNWCSVQVGFPTSAPNSHWQAINGFSTVCQLWHNSASHQACRSHCIPLLNISALA